MSIRVKTLIVEDEPSAVNRLIKELAKVESIAFEVLATIATVKDTINWFDTHQSVDLVFMDIHLNDGLSLEVFKHTKVNAPVIFTTAYDEYALQAFKVNSIDYLLKPINSSELKSAIKRFQETRESSSNDYLHQLTNLVESYKPTNYRSSFLVDYKHKMLMINVNDVAFFYIKEKGVYLKKTDGQEFLVDFVLDDLETQLDPRAFYRANRQFLVSKPSIKEIEPYFNGRLVLVVTPESNNPVIISKEKASQFKKWANY